MDKSMKGLKHFVMMLASFVVLLSWVVGSFSKASAQGCCSAGTPSLGALKEGVASEGQLGLSLLHEYNRLEQAFRGTRRAPDPLGRKTRVKTTSLELSYGFTRRVSASLIVHYSDKETKLTVTDTDNLTRKFSLDGRGLGDLVLLGKFSLITLDIVNQRELSIGAGVKLPTGDTRQEVNGVRLAIELQPGTGSVDGLLWGYFYQGFLPFPAHIFGNAIYRRPSANGDGYRVGHELKYYLGASYRTPKYFDFTAQVKWRTAGGDSFKDRPLLSTGGHWVYFMPGINLNIKTLSFQVFGQFPIYRNVEGIQLTPSYSFLLASYYKFYL